MEIQKVDRPILFSTPMIQSLLAGRKTQTRRMAAVPVGDHHGIDIMDWGLSEHPHLSEGKWTYTVQTDVDDSRAFELKPKYGHAGDIIWCRESWFPAAINGNKVMVGFYDKDPDNTYEFTTEKIDFYLKQMNKGRMIPSIHMPKEAARIWLQVTDVRVERLQDITEEDAQAEGVELVDYYDIPKDGIQYQAHSNKEAFESLWQSINSTESWDANPWVWVVSFEVLGFTGKPSTLTEKMEVL
jgi:hypothetical protein